MNEFYIGIDFGATNIRAVACGRDSKKISKVIKVSLIRKEDVIEEIEVNLIPLINRIFRKKTQEGKRLRGIGVAMAALFHRESGVITSWPNNNKYRDFPIQNYLQEHYGVPVILEDDANAAALGEQLAGAGVGLKDFIYVTISTGIGSGMIINDRLITGFHGWAGELGHIKVTDEDIVCSCGARGCLQAVASGTAILEKLKQGEEEKADIYDKAGRYIGGALANLVMLLDVPVIILGGGVMKTGDFLLEPIKKTVLESLENRRTVKIICSKLNDKNGVMGALNLCLKEKE